MGTRGFIGFIVDGTEKIAYNHWDSYPAGLGLEVLHWLRGEHLGFIQRKAAELRVVEPDSSPTEEEIQKLAQYTNRNVGGPSPRPTWYQVLRETQGNPGAMLDAGVIEDASGFPLDSLFAEWGYVVDLDASVFEVYEGFQRQPHSKGRFAGRGTPEPGASGSSYHPVALVASWPLSALPTDDEFMKVEGGDQS
jgi:hypothetical protein